MVAGDTNVVSAGISFNHRNDLVVSERSCGKNTSVGSRHSLNCQNSMDGLMCGSGNSSTRSSYRLQR